MGVKEQVFGSGQERDNYYKLQRRWGTSFNIYHNLPFLNVFSISDIQVNDVERSRLKKTSIDYTLCDKSDSPLVCIEFDGLYDGVNIGFEYHPAREPDSEWRELILSLKLRVAHTSQFPFFIVGTDLFEDLSPDLKLTIVDAIIGKVLASRAAHSRFAEGFDPEEMGWSSEAFGRLDRETRHEVVQDWVIDVEAIAELEHNPLRARASRLAYDYELGVSGFRTIWREFPEAIECALPFDPDFDIEKFKQRVMQLESALYVGATVTLDTADHGHIEKTVMLPHFKTPGLPFEGSVAQDIAKLLCLDHLYRARSSVQH